MTVEELYNKLGEMLKSEEVYNHSRVWIDRGTNTYDTLERTTSDIDNDLILIVD